MSAAEGFFDPVETLRETIAGLSVLDAEALEDLRAWASATNTVMPLEAQGVADMRSLHSSLARLLDSTARNLQTLRALHQAAIEAAQEAAWVR